MLEDALLSGTQCFSVASDHTLRIDCRSNWLLQTPDISRILHEQRRLDCLLLDKYGSLFMRPG
jgi:hypothetical protein